MRYGHNIFKFSLLLQFVSYLFVTFIKAHRIRLAMVYFSYTVFFPLDVKSNNIVKGLNPGVISKVGSKIVLGTPTATLTLRRTSTLALLRQLLYRTSEVPLKLLHVYYNLTIYVLHTNP